MVSPAANARRRVIALVILTLVGIVVLLGGAGVAVFWWMVSLFQLAPSGLLVEYTPRKFGGKIPEIQTAATPPTVRSPEVIGG
jgi:hypothetical protein